MPGQPVAWKRPRRGQAHGKQWRFTDPLVKSWQDKVGQLWMASGRPFFDGPLSVSLDFTLERGHTKRSYPPQDCDNLAKGVLDALQGLAFNNDAQVVGLTVTKQYGDTPGVDIKLSL